MSLLKSSKVWMWLGSFSSWKHVADCGRLQLVTTTARCEDRTSQPLQKATRLLSISGVPVKCNKYKWAEDNKTVELAKVFLSLDEKKSLLKDLFL